MWADHGEFHTSRECSAFSHCSHSPLSTQYIWSEQLVPTQPIKEIGKVHEWDKSAFCQHSSIMNSDLLLSLKRKVSNQCILSALTWLRNSQYLINTLTNIDVCTSNFCTNTHIQWGMSIFSNTQASNVALPPQCIHQQIKRYVLPEALPAQ